MIVWSGKGFVAVLILLVSLFLFATVFPKDYADYAFVLAFFITAAFCWFFGKKWNEQDGRTVIDKASGKEFMIVPNHSLFWIKLQYWAYIFGVIILAQAIIKAFA